MLPCFITQDDPKRYGSGIGIILSLLAAPEPACLNFTHYIFRLGSHLSEYGNFQEKPFEMLWDDIFGMSEAYFQRGPVTVTY